MAVCSQEITRDFGVSLLQKCVALYKTKEYHWKLKESEVWKEFESVNTHAFFSVSLIKFIILRAKEELMAFMFFTKYQSVKYTMLVELEFERDCLLSYSESWQGFADFDSRDVASLWWKKINRLFSGIDNIIDSWMVSIPEHEVLTLVKFKYCKAKTEFAVARVQQPALTSGWRRPPPSSSSSATTAPFTPTPNSPLI
jgi:hypothetical protein